MWEDEELIKFSTMPEKIISYVDLQGFKYKKNLEFPGLYSFWFWNKDRIANDLKREIVVHGPEKKPQSVIWDWNLDKDLICLYVGKSTNLQHRLGLHLLLKTPNLYQVKSDRLIKKTTSCQLRSGFDYLFQEWQDINIFELMSKRLYFSCFQETSFIKRFYMEDYLIGTLYPWFNVDSER